MFHGKLVVQASPCTACVMLNHYTTESLERAVKKRDDFTYEIIEIKNPSDVFVVEGLEVEKLPALLINDEQISAGTIVPYKMLEKYLAQFE